MLGPCLLLDAGSSEGTGNSPARPAPDSLHLSLHLGLSVGPAQGKPCSHFMKRIKLGRGAALEGLSADPGVGPQAAREPAWSWRAVSWGHQAGD